ncbi:MAG: hypothetical protein IPK10_16015 [Bacteroidetes bacterium]|nr:hypothetical protein [Bacteroidota bacterium]
MTENSEEEQIEESTNTHSENNSSEIQSKQNSDEINSNQEIENMEVHHHAHHDGKKNWKSYFWEFLMLFLAVTLGFFVENQREHYIENLRAKEYSKSLIQDLQNDIIAIQRQTKTATMFIGLADSLINLSPTHLEGKASAQFSFYTRFMYWTGSIILEQGHV